MPESLSRVSSGRKAVMHERIHFPQLFCRQVIFWIEISNCATEARRKRAHIKARDRPDTTFPVRARSAMRWQSCCQRVKRCLGL